MLATTVGVHVAGTTGTENFRLLVDGAVVANWTNTRVLTSARVFDPFVYASPTDVSIDRIRVEFTNDGAGPGGVNRDLVVDGVTLNGVKYESEALSVYSTGFWDSATNGRLPGYRQSERLAYNGYLQFGSRGSSVQIRAAGATGTEQMQLFIGTTAVATFSNVGGSYAGAQFATFNYDNPSAVALSQIRIAYTNDGPGPGGADRNLRIDGVVLDGMKFETEAPSVYTNATYTAGQGRTFGRLQTEFMQLNGYFQFGAFGTVVEVRAAGRTGEEQAELQLGGSTVAVFPNIGGNYSGATYQALVYNNPTPVTIDQVRVLYTNDGNTAGGVDRNLRVDSVVLDGTAFQTEAADTFSTGTYIAGIGRYPGLWQSEYLHTNGYFQYASGANPGTVALGTALITVDEFTPSVSIPVVRSGGSDGTVGLRYTTVNASAIAGSDFTATSGQILFLPGETLKYIVVPILNDGIREANEVFNVAADQVIGGASITQPRTASITIVDDELPPTPGSGNGILGQYFNNIDLTAPVFERTDATINFDWGNGSPSSFIGADTFSVRWLGKIEPLYTETYTFYANSDDGVRLWVNNQLIIDQWRDLNAEVSGQIDLVRGRKYDIKLEYFENSGGAREILRWSSASQTLQVVPQSQLYSDPPAPSELGTFTAQDLITNLGASTAIDFDSNGRMFIALMHGEVKVYQNGQLLSAPFLFNPQDVNFFQDRGMLGVAVHPDFPNTPYVYVAYTYDPPETAGRSGNAGPDGGGNRVARVSRFTADPAYNFNRAIPGSEVVIVGTNSVWANISHPELDSTDDISLPPSGGQNGEMRDILIADSRSHTIGNIGFGPDGKLYIANGDGTSYGRVDPRSSRVQSIDSLSGKILRVDPITGKGLSDNPFYNGDPDSNRSKVYDYGLRNPFRFAFQPTTGQVYMSDVGWNTWEEINTGGGQNFGWPYYEGGNGQSLQTGGYRDLPEAQAFYASNPTVAAPLWARTHSEGATAMVVGDFYTGTIYPSSYRNALFINDYGDQQFRVLRLNADGSLNSVSLMGLNIGPVVEMTMGKDGYLYYVHLGGKVGRLIFNPAVNSVNENPDPAVTLAAMGDFTGDGFVDGADILIWQQAAGNVNVGEGAGLIPGDANFDNQVTNVDLGVVQTNFGYHRDDLTPPIPVDTSPEAGGGANNSAAILADEAANWLAAVGARSSLRAAYVPMRREALTDDGESVDAAFEELEQSDGTLLGVGSAL